MSCAALRCAAQAGRQTPLCRSRVGVVLKGRTFKDGGHVHGTRDVDQGKRGMVAEPCTPRSKQADKAGGMLGACSGGGFSIIDATRLRSPRVDSICVAVC